MEKLEPALQLVREVETWKVLIVPMIIMVFDYITGFLKAVKNKNVVSSKLRDGLIKKSGECITILIPVLLQYLIGLPKEITLGIACYVSIMELISICENLGKLGVPVPKFIKEHLECLVKEE